MLLNLITMASEAEADKGVSPWLVGGGIFTFLVLLMVALLAFGGGREHS